MRVGLTYDRKAGRFVVRNMDNLDSIEERVSQIISKQVKFKRAEQAAAGPEEGDIMKECFVDSNAIACARCEYVDDCPTHTISGLKFCLCDETLADPDSYQAYVAKRIPAKRAPRTRKVAARRKSR
jgi:hypothetical protein